MARGGASGKAARPASNGDRTAELRELMRERILVLDGATGTALQAHALTPADFGGPALEGCNEHLVLTRPDVVTALHEGYLAAGADIIETNTFQATPLVLAEFALDAEAQRINRRAARLASRAAVDHTRPGKPRFVAGSMGPTTKSISVTGGVTFDELVAAFAVQARGLIEGGVDLYLIETCQDTLVTKAALIAVRRVLREAGESRPVILSATIEPTGTMLAGQSIAAFVISMAHADALAFGLNCATGPEFMTDHIRALHEMGVPAVSCYPNAGLPDADGSYPETPDSLASALERLVDRGWLNIVGGCCGTGPDHIRTLADMVYGKPPRSPDAPAPRSLYSGIDVVEATEETRPVLVGERTNVLGSREFRRLVERGAWEEAAQVARDQVAAGAQIVDVCLQTAERSERDDTRELYERLMRTVRAPFMIDAADPPVIEVALQHSQGKSIVNSVSLEDGGIRLARVCPLLKQYGAAVVVGAIDESEHQAQALLRQRKLDVLLRAHALITREHGISEEDVILDPLVFPAASGDIAYIGSAVETIEALRLLKLELPRSKTILGVSNVSFGLPARARELVNSVFLHLATEAGLDLAIVNTERIERYATLADSAREMAEDLLYNRAPRLVDPDTPEYEHIVDAPQDYRRQTARQRMAINRLNVERMAAYARGPAAQRSTRAPDSTLDERLERYIIEGTRMGLAEDLEAALAGGATPLEILNGPLMSGMSEVGRLFNAGELIVAEVLASAESMKTAVILLEDHMPVGGTARRGRVLLATVKGDVHDIGKNLVDIILTNNGYDVIDLGIRTPPEVLIRAVREHEPAAVGLSGLLVRSAQQMITTAEDLRAAGIDVPLLVGGAALSAAFTRERIAPAYGGEVYYCGDAMVGLSTMNAITRDRAKGADPAPGEPTPPSMAPTTAAERAPQERSPEVSAAIEALPVPYPERRVVTTSELTEIWRYLNTQMLFGKHLGFEGRFAAALENGDARAQRLATQVAEVQDEMAHWLRVSAVWRFFEAESRGNSVSVFLPGETVPTHEFIFPRQDAPPRLSLADYVLPVRDGMRDSLAAFVVSAGQDVFAHSREARDRGEYFRSHAIQAIAIATAEAAAEWLHRRLREDWGIPDPPGLTMHELLQGRYRGKRYSFGYPACPDLAHQRALWRLLEPEDIDVQLTEEYMMDPEASVSALVFHHPDARRFSAVLPR